MYATSGESGGTIYEKVAPLAAISFPNGKGTPFLRDADSAYLNDATSMKGNANATTGVVVLGHNSQTRRYWHNELPLGTPELQADFSATPRAGVAPLIVSFTDTSTGSPTSWSWDFGDGTSSSEQHPSHTYAAAGTYTVSLIVTDATGASSTGTRSGYVTVTNDLVVAAVGDAFVRSNAPTKNQGSDATLQVRDGNTSGPTYVSYLKFTVSGLPSAVRSAALRLYVEDPARDGGSVYLVGNDWTEGGITWNNAPMVGADPLAVLGRANAATWIEIELPASAFDAGDGTYSFAVKSGDPGAGSVWYSSREGSQPPELVLR
jgi:PKD repeat protein